MPCLRSIPDTFFYPAAWEDEYRATRRVRQWEREWPEQFGGSHTSKRKPGTLQYFAQYALMNLLRQNHGIQSITWLHIAQVDRQTRRRVAAGQRWERARPGPSAKQSRTQEHWNLMREKMGGDNFDKLQEQVVREGFSRHTGEPDLFCFTKDGEWFFAEAKTPREPLGAHQQRWFDIARRLADVNCPVHVCRVVRDDSAGD